MEYGMTNLQFKALIRTYKALLDERKYDKLSEVLNKVLNDDDDDDK